MKAIPNATFYLGNILSAIERKKFSVRQVCTQAGIAPGLVSAWKAGRVEPKLSSLQKLQAAFVELLEARA